MAKGEEIGREMRLVCVVIYWVGFLGLPIVLVKFGERREKR
jgi:hypothetical protein